MCFSPSVSFGASAVLMGIGVASLWSSRTLPEKVLACIPVIFSVQQFTEGVLWIALQDPAHWQWEKPTTYAYLIFAQVVWPIYMPIAMLLFERERRRKQLMMLLVPAGLVLGTYLLYCLLHYSVRAVAQHNHIRYDLGSAISTKWFFGLLYFIPTIIAPICSSIKRMPLLGYLFFISYVISRLLFHYYVISVWCFFGAVISIVVLYILLHPDRTGRKNSQAVPF